MIIDVGKRDLIWSYLATFFQMASGILVLPLILNKLTPEEIGFNYIILTIGTLVSLVETGFSPIYGKNISYIYSGAKELREEGVAHIRSDELDYNLLSATIGVARRVYHWLGIGALVIMLTFGTWYTGYVTDGFRSVDRALAVWLVYSASIYFNLYYGYYFSLLLGCGKIKEAKKAVICAKLCYITCCVIFLYAGLGLLGVCIANLISPFISRFMAYRFYFTPELRGKLNIYKSSNDRMKEIFRVLLPNTKKMSVAMIGAYCISKASIFIGGLFITLEEMGSYGLMIQVGGIIITLSTTYFNVLQPRLSAYKVENRRKLLNSEFLKTWIVFVVMAVCGFLILTFAGDWILSLIGSKTELPSILITGIYCGFLFLEANHSMCINFLVVGNRVPPFTATLIPGAFIVVGSVVVLKFTSLGILGLVLVQGFVQFAYNDWKWPVEAAKEMHLPLNRWPLIGISSFFNKVNETAV